MTGCDGTGVTVALASQCLSNSCKNEALVVTKAVQKEGELASCCCLPGGIHLLCLCLPSDSTERLHSALDTASLCVEGMMLVHSI